MRRRLDLPAVALTKEQTQGPYWFDVDSIRADIREDRPGAVPALAPRVHDGPGARPATPPPPCRMPSWRSGTAQVYGSAPYNGHTGRDTTNANDSIFDRSGLLTAEPQGNCYLGVVNPGINV